MATYLLFTQRRTRWTGGRPATIVNQWTRGPIVGRAADCYITGVGTIGRYAE